MKQILTIVTFTFLLLTTSCHAQMMRTLNDAQRLKANEKEFIGKPLKTLLKEIKPEIKMVYGESNRADSAPSYFFFQFVNRKEYYQERAKDKYPLSITVYVKGNFDWDRSKLTADERLKWNMEDEKKYGNLIITGIRVAGEN